MSHDIEIIGDGRVGMLVRSARLVSIQVGGKIILVQVDEEKLLVLWHLFCALMKAQ